MSLRKDTLSHAYELMKVEDPRKRRGWPTQVARGELTLVKLREKIEGRPARVAPDRTRAEPSVAAERRRPDGRGGRGGWTGARRTSAARIADDSLVAAKQQLTDAVEELLGVLRSPDVLGGIGPDGPGEPRQVPDDRQAPAGERDRGRPQRRRGRGRSCGRPRGHEEAGAEAPASCCRLRVAGQWPFAACRSAFAASRAALRSALAASRSAFAASLLACFSGS